MRNKYDEMLDDLNQNIIQMGNLVSERISHSVESLLTKDKPLAKSVATGDDDVNRLEREIENKAMILLLKQQPVASDLRFISSALKMVTDMERIGDQAEDIAELVLCLIKVKYDPSKLGSIKAMSEVATGMVEKSVQAFVTGDLALADEVIKTDDVVDKYFTDVRDELIQRLKKDENPKVAIDFLLITKYLERIADHAVNICEWVDFSVSGRLKPLSSEE